MTTNCTDRTRTALQAIAEAGDEGRRIFTKVYAAQAMAEANAADARAQAGIALSPIDGLIVSIKDLFDVAGEPTTAGSKVLVNTAPAKQDAEIVRRLRAAGAVVIGKTNMTEFAFSGIGINPHYGTPGNAKDVARIPGGSSSGAGVAVARGMCDIAIGSDTGGSIRIPSALNGVTGFKPSQSRVSREGAFPLSFTLDTVGPLARSVEDCAKADAVLAGEKFKPLAKRSVHGLRIGIPRGLLFTQVDDMVNQAFNSAVEKLQSLGAKVQVIDIENLINAPFKLQENGTMIASEAAAIHADIFAQGKDDQLDALVKSRITRGQEITASHYVSVKQAREKLMPEFDAATADFDVLVLPTVAVVAPTIASLEVADEFHRVNGLVLRNTSVFNFYDLPACSLPISVGKDQLPVGMMVVGQRQRDHDLLGVAEAISHSI